MSLLRHRRNHAAPSAPPAPAGPTAAEGRREAAAHLTAERRIADLDAEARHARERLQLYRARSYGPRDSSARRLDELQRTSDAAESRVAQARRDLAG